CTLGALDVIECADAQDLVVERRLTMRVNGVKRAAADADRQHEHCGDAPHRVDEVSSFLCVDGATDARPERVARPARLKRLRGLADVLPRGEFLQTRVATAGMLRRELHRRAVAFEKE